MAMQLAPVLDIKTICPHSPFPDFKMASMNDAECAAIEFEEVHSHPHYEILWLQSGAGILHIDMEQYPFDAPVVFILSPGQLHQLEQTTAVSGHIIKFLPSVFNSEKDFTDYVIDTCLFDCATLQPVIKITESIALFEEIIAQAFREYRHPQTDSKQIISAYLKILITHINRAKRKDLSPAASITNPAYAVYRNFRIELQKHFKQQHSVQFYADRLHISARALNDVCKKLGGRSASDIIQDRILLEAKRYLHYHRQSIKEICFALGFDDPAYFTRFFKKHTGFSPQQFKQQQLHSEAVPA